MGPSRTRSLIRVPRLCAPIAALCLAAVIAATSSGCASRPLAGAAALPTPTAKLAAGPLRLLDQNRAVLRLEATIRNPRAASLTLEAAECAVAIDGAAAPFAAAPPSAALMAERTPPRAVLGSPIAAGSEAAVAFELAVDLRSLDESVRGPDGPADAAWTAAARFILRSPDGSAVELVSAAGGTIPIVREPILRITSLKIERDILVTTGLRLGLEVRNPNSFPVEIRSVSYDFRGEGKLWASGEDAEGATVPARGVIERGLRFTMNFSDADRRLFDLVAKLRTVRYGLGGSATVATGLEAMPTFTLGFDLEGSCPVRE